MIAIPKNELCIFLVDDQEITNFINKKLIDVTGMCNKVYDFLEPAKALDHLEQHQPNLIFLDLNMPKISGWDFLEKMENYNTSADVVIVTSSTSVLDKEKAKTFSRVKDYYIKPLKIDAVRELISKYQ
ncbi:response regulator [uncultured Maribacter sp.]|uniref:response regulator n=1 Tax=uncultured Maribacter sp. TaxID=431308 RepID=UPI0030EEAF96|tara:strand:- start:53946 stop:54329 length:384 start_codon:yes stop_codon:yes gene_type:complete